MTVKPLDPHEVQFGIDVAEGGDSTVVAVRRGRRIEELNVWTEPDLMQTVEKIRTVADRWGVVPRIDFPEGHARRGIYQERRGRIVVDAIGVGAGVASRLHELKYRVDSFKGNEKAPAPRSKHDIEFGNVRAAAYWHVRQLLYEDGLDLPADPRLREEILATGLVESPSNGRLYVEDKRGLRDRLGRSPDRCDAVVLACYKPYSFLYTGPTIECSW